MRLSLWAGMISTMPVHATMTLDGRLMEQGGEELADQGSDRGDERWHF